MNQAEAQQLVDRLSTEPFDVVHDRMGGVGFAFYRVLTAAEVQAWKAVTGVRPMPRDERQLATLIELRGKRPKTRTPGGR